jgi:hypothetical protein
VAGDGSAIQLVGVVLVAVVFPEAGVLHRIDEIGIFTAEDAEKRRGIKNMNTTYADPTRTYKKPGQERTGEFVATLEQNRAGDWLVRINGGLPMIATDVEVYLWKQLVEIKHGA